MNTRSPALPPGAVGVTLAMLAHAFLAVVRPEEHAHRPGPDGLTPLTWNEIRHLFPALAVRPIHGRRGHLGRARTR
ncbi:hypothetical protein [Streptomyces sp. 11-1-2]|uniref:hypothetical protein n=1 Tax=Streptomyces sp. 11-1-2 TaxID=1851167 RepID=UPI0019695543|nr:hypothetical protein [Streptomyces sp. 11-1-2]